MSVVERSWANVICRLEEILVTRSLYRKAKLMEGTPTLLRLKELEVSESVSEKIQELKIYGGLDGLMNWTVRWGWLKWLY